MADPVVLRIIFGDGTDSRKLHLVSGIPETVAELHHLVKTCFQLHEDFRMQYMDSDFKEFMNLTSTSEIQNKSTVKVIYMSLTPPEDSYITLHPVEPSDEATTSSNAQTFCSSSVASSSSADTLYTSTPHSSPEIQLGGLSSWPKVFVVPKFTYEAEFELQQKNNEFETNGTHFNPG